MYIPLIQAAQNDVKALLNLEDSIKEKVIPLMDICGKADTHISNFCSKWPENHSFFIDCSPVGIALSKAPNQQQEKHLITDLNLDDPSNSFIARQNFYQGLKAIHNSIIPAVSWEGVNATRRDVSRFAIDLLADFNEIAVRVCLWNEKSNHLANLDYTKAILDAVDDQARVWLLIDQGPLDHPNDLTTSAKINDYLDVINSTGLKGWAVISTSFPDKRPSSGSQQTAISIDFGAQSLLTTPNTTSIRAYGDYASSTLGSATAFVMGMHIIPFASYLKDFEWWLAREGSNMEYDKYIDLAKDLVALQQFQGPHFCWANEQYDRISKISDPAKKGYGHNGTWNGYRANQHITEIIRCIAFYGFPAPLSSPQDEDCDDI
ncbi:hypothetical protein GGR41_000531 [Paenalcaligenes hominis]|uniref:Peptidase S8/S53 domain-containing protein n=1 Tax=Paenalcaligenes hominis TaxID=643674 RepID=A0ABX0WNI2_9BURK|nr:hypothetical protein [Paenalcaligenes hominis]NJB64310.1 hypothetical protein [Paenalcaligenes hominis]GGE68632.1 hypothetical protein GCM10007278_15900 [Paenalcaligenes hominis]